MKIPYFCCIGAELKRYAQDFDFMNQVYLYKVPTDDSIDEVLSEDYFKAISNSVLQDDIVYIYEASAETLHECRFNKQNGHITAVPLASDETLTGAVTSIIHDNLTPNKLLKSDENGKVAASDFSEKDFVKVDGTSIMTGPLKFMAGSMRGAIAPYLNGVSFWKMDSQGNITNIANLTDSQFLPVTTNSIDLGNTTHTWKNLYLSGKAYMSVINNGYDIAVPTTAGTMALLSDIAFTSEDVKIEDPQDGEFLMYEDGKWTNTTQGYANTDLDNLTDTGKAKLYHPDLFDWKWADHEINDMQWLRADTFSWQDGTVYEEAYQHLVDDVTGKTATSETVGGVTISFYLADDGHKITTDESAVANIYTATGVAWYYVLDTANQRFKLPRTQFGVTGLRDTVGNYVAPGLPNITGSMDIGQSGEAAGRFMNSLNPSGAIKPKHTSVAIWSGSAYWGTGTSGISIDASDSNSIYGNSNTVQTPATQMYLYFYVGQFTQTALENTAGLNASLFNAKADIDLSNLTASGKEVCAHQAMPSSRIDTLTAVTSGGSYAAPADGYFVARATANAAGNYLELTGRVDSLIHSQAIGLDLSVYIPVSKNETVTLYYSTNTPTVRFVYANGAQ